MYNDLSGTFYQNTQGLKKFTDDAMIIQMVSRKPGFLNIGWSEMGTMNCNFSSGTGSIDANVCTQVLSVDSTKQIKSTWTQLNNGEMSADISVTQ